MELCGNGHKEVCFEGGNCPVCTMAETKDFKIESLQADNDSLTVLIDKIEKDTS